MRLFPNSRKAPALGPRNVQPARTCSQARSPAFFQIPQAGASAKDAESSDVGLDPRRVHAPKHLDRLAAMPVLGECRDDEVPGEEASSREGVEDLDGVVDAAAFAIHLEEVIAEEATMWAWIRRPCGRSAALGARRRSGAPGRATGIASGRRGAKVYSGYARNMLVKVFYTFGPKLKLSVYKLTRASAKQSSMASNMIALILILLVVVWAAPFAIARPAALEGDRALEIKNMFEDWAAKHGKSYSSDSEKARRLMIFSDTLAYIEKHNAQPNTTFTLGLNKFSDLTNAEFRANYVGKFKSPRYQDRRPAKDVDVDVSSLPTSLDWRQEGAVTPIKDQGQCGSCWAFSAIASIESAHFLATKELVSLSEQQLIDCDTVDQGCQGGFPEDAFKFVVENGGVTTEEAYPYTGFAGSCNANKNKVVEITGYKDVTKDSADALMKAVSKTPVTVGICGSDQNFQNYRSGILSGQCSNSRDHAVLVIGYGTEGGMPYWIIKNSWGTSWGENGFMKIKKKDGEGMLDPELDIATASRSRESCRLAAAMEP
ncbi:senescence-specific cysteine protease SAG39 [Selaginella moellendorffii]|uniref:senescence-specific cysteine protease SAG39 n=1 Tax=Selaginella moellendorffii TaxID=88036 RepID=UPI000D1C23EB|nr:senescence-specific cysteine protease SAG39 [Selaginella moellendorffii]|eukprot:XP_002977185.2 senescence-specific cysteine protease SAG39 [Selaginella moellendorffii]